MISERSVLAARENARDLDSVRTASAPKAIILFLMVNTFETGGSERQFTVLAQNFKPPQFQVNVGCINPRGPLAHHFPAAPQFSLGGKLFGFQSMRSRLNLSRHLRQYQVEVAHAFDFYANLTLIPAAKLARVPVVIGSHRQIGDLMTPTQFRLQTAAFRWCDAVVCNSEAAAARLIKAGISRGKIAVIGNALLNAAFAGAHPLLPKRLNVVRAGMVARMNHRYKNHSGFLRMAAKIHQHIPNAEFVLVGDGPLRPDLEREAAGLGLGSSVIFMGDRQDMPEVLASLDVAVNPSDSESLSNVILEAMAARLPVIAYDVGGNSELLLREDHTSQGELTVRPDQKGFLVAAGDEGNFTAALEKLLGDPALRQGMGANGFLFAQERFSLSNVCQSYADLYNSLLEKKHRRRISAS